MPGLIETVSTLEESETKRERREKQKKRNERSEKCLQLESDPGQPEEFMYIRSERLQNLYFRHIALQ